MIELYCVAGSEDKRPLIFAELAKYENNIQYNGRTFNKSIQWDEYDPVFYTFKYHGNDKLILSTFSSFENRNFVDYCVKVGDCINELREKATTKKVKPPKQPLTFAGLFKPEYKEKLNILFERLKLNGYTDENNKWIIKNNTNEPAKLYHYLKDKLVLNNVKFAPAIKCFYKEFDCEVVEKYNGNPRATTRANADRAQYAVYYDEFDRMLSIWINQK